MPQLNEPTAVKETLVPPVRTCVGCGQRSARAKMVRIAAFNGTAYVDPKGKLPGRGAWFHPDPRCISRGRQRKALARRLRFDGEIPESLWHTLEQIAATATHGAS